MRKIPDKLRNELALDPFMHQCARKGPDCQGRITWEHAFIYAGKQINERWAIIPLCAYHHAVDEFQDGGAFDKDLNQYIALMRATVGDLKKYPDADWGHRFAYLVSKFHPTIVLESLHGSHSDCRDEDCMMCATIDEYV